ncbi:MAG: Lacal_2735 family protein [Cyclobacteriaceae bacterium]|nr:Lacal_2735 family protein [Cyclobacteriaceae bacterium]
MFNFLKKDPVKELEKQRKKLLEEAMYVQRSGDLRLYAEKMVIIDKLEKQLEALQSPKN